MGEDPKNKPGYSALIFAVICLIVLGWYFKDSIGDFGSGSDPEYEVTAVQLMDEYSDNEIAADLKYKDKVIVVSGKVVDRAKDLANQIYIALYTGRALFSVQCFFSDKYASEVAEVKTGAIVKIKGKVNGKFGNVILKGCRII